jgi:hypothetical protein
MPEHSFLPPHGNYTELLSYRKAEIVYDLTVIRQFKVGRESALQNQPGE